MHVVASPMHFNAMQKVLSIVRSVPRETSANRRTIDLDRRSSMTPRSTAPIVLSLNFFHSEVADRCGAFLARPPPIGERLTSIVAQAWHRDRLNRSHYPSQLFRSTFALKTQTR